jgi:divalent metal cation (Fe/Co/Zn/Cd) transporter
VLLGRETGALLVGERTNRAKIERVRTIISSDAAVEHIGELLTMQLGPQQALLTVQVTFRQPLGLKELESAVHRIKESIRRQEPTFREIFIEADSQAGSSDRSDEA